MTNLSKYVHAMGRGPSKGRNLDADEACDAMRLILSGKAAPEAVGALFMLMRYRGELGAEIAGFVRAMREDLTQWSHLQAHVDWPSYAAGRTRGLPWFILSALLVGSAGHKVFMHGWNSHQKSMAGAVGSLQALGLPTCETAAQAETELARIGFAYAPLSTLHPEILRLLKLRSVLGLRSPVNTACRALNPTLAKLSVLGVFHPSYRALQVEASALLGQDGLAAIKGGGGEFECNPSKDIEVFSLINGNETRFTIPAVHEKGQRLADASIDTSDLTGLWHGTVQNEFALNIVLNTAAVALLALGEAEQIDDARDLAQKLWDERGAINLPAKDMS